MRKTTLIGGVILTLAGTAAATSLTQPTLVPNMQESAALTSMMPVETGEESCGPALTRTAPQVNPKVAIKSIDDIVGQYAFGYTPTRSNFYPVTQNVEIKHIAGTDSVMITPFFWSDCSIKGKVNLEEGTIFFPRQVVYQKGTDIRSFTKYTTAVDWSEGTGVTLALQDNGNLAFTSGWAIMVDNSTSGYMWCRSGIATVNMLFKANARMLYKAAPTSSTPNPSVYYYNVNITQTGNRIDAIGFYGCKTPVSFMLQPDRTTYVAEQEVKSANLATTVDGATVDTRVDYNLIGDIVMSDNGSFTYRRSFYTDAAPADNNKYVSFKNWSLYSAAANRWYGLQEYAQITTDFDLVYPAPLSFKGTGTAADPYLISSVADWDEMAKACKGDINFFGKYLKLTADIDFDGKEISPIECSFAGTLDGDGHTLKNFIRTNSSNYQGFFYSIAPTGVIRNLTLDGKVTAENITVQTYVSGMVGYLYGSLINVVNKSEVDGKQANGLVSSAETGAYLKGCINKGHIINEAGGYTGGLVSNAKYGVTFEDCSNEGTITVVKTGSSIGGIVGQAANGNFINCFNTGKFETDSTIYNIGGIIGNATGVSNQTTMEQLVLRNCYNTADIKAKGALGGLIGYRQSGLNKAALEVTDCYNTGNLYFPQKENTTNSTSPIGGLIGVTVPGTYSNCYNTGKLIGTQSQAVGGLFGKVNKYSKDSTEFLVKNCYNKGLIEVKNPGSAYIGGIVGYLYDDAPVLIDSCYNTADIYGCYMVGGIVGNAEKLDNTIRNCWNSGNITSMYKWTGGIVGSSIKSTTTIEYCWNSGAISTEGTLGGNDNETTKATPTGNAIGGIIGRSGAKVSNCYNLGSVKGAAQIGGIVGLTELDSAQVVKCYNLGALIAAPDSCGAILGVKTVDNPTIYGEKNKVEDCYYVTDFGAIGNNNLVGTGKTMAELTSNFKMGEGWANVGDYCTPTFEYCKTEPAALVGVAQAVLDNCKYDLVTHNFHVGTPAGVTWSADKNVVKFDGNTAIVEPESSKVDVVLTATAGDFSKTIEMTVDGVTGLEAVADTLDVVAEEYYTASGIRTAKPESKDGQVYVVVLKLSDGTSKTVKMRN